MGTLKKEGELASRALQGVKAVIELLDGPVKHVLCSTQRTVKLTYRLLLSRFSKNSEKRKEKSRDAARCRRSKESEIFTELSQQLPLPENVACQLDKASVMRLAISYLRLREILEPMAEVAKSADCSPYDSSVLEALDAVLLVLSAEGEIVFLSGNVGRHLGLNQNVLQTCFLATQKILRRWI
ncbi:hypothetical protein V5799_006084 [Amblyomma americanum]|uniref:BHLH domain-containing protein n=1 Tax=Amblyomma americanum TaxID=6943 RepID=A0AAQ4DXE0_AMBAM